MSDSDSDYQVESYFKPTIKKSTYNNQDDAYLSEGTDSEKINDSGTEEEIHDIQPKSQCMLNKSTPEEIKNEKEHAEGRTNSRFILYISNLSSDTTRSMIETFFMDAGHVKSVRIPKKRLSNFGFVEMTDVNGYKNGLKYDGKELDGKKIKVQPGSKNKKHVSNKSKIQKKMRFQIFEQKKLQNKAKYT